MKINGLNCINIAKNYPKKTEKHILNNLSEEQRTASPSFCRLNVFLKDFKLNQFSERSYAKLFFDKEGRVSAKECENVIRQHPATVAKAYKIQNEKAYFTQSPNLTAKAGVVLKEYFDKTYKNYRIVSIGTSPAGICQAMEYLGAEVIYLPVTGAKKIDGMLYKGFLHRKDKLADVRNVKILINYFKSKVKKNDQKKNILIDYTVSGKTLSIIEKILSENSGLKKENFESHGLIQSLKKAKKESNRELLSDYEIDEIYSDCLSQSVEYIANVPHFNLDEADNSYLNCSSLENYVTTKGKTNKAVFWEFDTYSTDLGRAYNLCTYNELKKMGEI